MLIEYKHISFGATRLALIEQANEIIEDYEADGYTLSLRQLYYQFVARDIIPNSERSYKNLGNLINDARMAGMISWESIEDRGRGIKPWLIQEDEREVLRDIEYQFGLDFWERQKIYVEVWVEKDALTSVIERPCQRYRIPYMPCKGYLSASEMWRAGQRFKEKYLADHECILIHLGDHDPSGLDMTRDSIDRLDMLSFGTPVDVRRIALNMDQIERYRPPPNPAKITDSRAKEYIAEYGETSWELDALEPRVLEKLIVDEVNTFVDASVWAATQKEERERRQILARLHERFDDVVELLKMED